MGKGETTALEDFLLFCCSPRGPSKLGSKANSSSKSPWRVGADGLMELSPGSGNAAEESVQPKIVGSCHFIERYAGGTRLEVEVTQAAPDVCIKDCTPPPGSDVLHVVITGPLRFLTVNSCRQVVISSPSCSTVDTVHCHLVQFHFTSGSMPGSPSISMSHCKDVLLVLPATGASGHIMTSHCESLCFTSAGVMGADVVTIPCEFGVLYQVINGSLFTKHPLQASLPSANSELRDARQPQFVRS
jgi:hypothetical protein